MSGCVAGSLFALEVLHRSGMQFFEVSTFAVLAGAQLCWQAHISVCRSALRRRLNPQASQHIPEQLLRAG